MILFIKPTFYMILSLFFPHWMTSKVKNVNLAVKQYCYKIMNRGIKMPTDNTCNELNLSLFNTLEDKSAAFEMINKCINNAFNNSLAVFTKKYLKRMNFKSPVRLYSYAFL